MPSNIISFIDEGMYHVTNPHDDALVITFKMNDFDVKRILVDSGSLTDVLFLDALLVMEKTKQDLRDGGLPADRICWMDHLPLGAINLPIVWVKGGRGYVGTSSS